MRLFGESKNLLLIFGNLASAMMVLWCSRSFYFHADMAGWGDAAADRQQRMLWWARMFSLIIFGASVILSAAYSSRYRWSVLVGAAVTGSLWWISKFQGMSYVSSLLLAGWFGEAAVFGVHADLSSMTTPLCWMLGFDTVLYASIISLMWPRPRGRVLGK